MKGWQGWATPYISVMEKSSFDWLDQEFGILEPQMVERRYSIPTFGACFDYLTEKGIYVGITRTFARWGWLLFQDHAILQEHYESWHEAANAAIEKALTLI